MKEDFAPRRTGLKIPGPLSGRASSSLARAPLTKLFEHNKKPIKYHAIHLNHKHLSY